MKKGFLCHLAVFVFYIVSLTNLQAQCPAIPIEEAIKNGDFELGYVSDPADPNFFETQYQRFIPCLNGCYSAPNQFLIDTGGTPAAFNKGAFDGVYDHTFADGSGNFLQVDGSSAAGTIVWKQTVDVYPNQKYFFSTWVTTIVKNESAFSAAKLQFYINNVPVGGEFQPSLIQGQWTQFFETYTTGGGQTSLTISLVNQQTASSGNDFAVDDISFINGCQNTANGPIPDLGESLSLCTNGDITISSKTNISAANHIYWKRDAIDLTADFEKTTILAAVPGKYQVCVDYNNCIRSSMVEITNKIKVDVPDMTVCDEKSKLVDTKLTGTRLSYVWRKGGSTVGGNTPAYTVPVGGAGTYSVTVSSSHPSCASSSTTDDFILTGKDCYQITASATPTTPCIGSDVTLSALTNGYVEKWEDAAGNILGTTSTLVVNPPLATNTYKVTAKFPTDTVSKNGDFENVFSDFTSDYFKRIETQFQNGDYLIVKGNETYLQDALQNTTDISGTGNMLLVKGANDKRTLVIYSQTVAVTPGVQHGLSFYLKNLIANLANSAPVDLEVRINGTKAFEVHQPLNNDWKYYSYLWTPTVATAKIEIVGMDTYNEYKFRILAFDNIYVAAAGAPESATVVVNASDCRTLVARPDTTACIGTPVKLTAITNGFITGWTPAAGLDFPKSTTPSASPLQTTVYTVEAKFPLTKLFQNSYFSNGNAGITSSLTYKSGNNPNQNEYTIVKGNENWLNYPYNLPMTDHTTGNGQFFLSTVSLDQNRTVFEQSISVTSGESYGLSFFITNAHRDFNNAADIVLQIKIGTEVVTVSAPKDRNWHEAKYAWTSSVSGNVTVSIVSPLDAASNGRMRVFGLDDLILTSLGNPKTAPVLITTTDCFEIDTKITSPCQGDSIKIEAETNGLFTGWKVLGGGTAGIKTPNRLETWVKPAVVTKYIATAELQLGNLVPNGDFEQGVAGFKFDPPYTDHSSLSNGMGGGNVAVTNDPSKHNSTYYSPIKDHTTGSGNMFIADADNLADNREYYVENIPVKAGQRYAFSAWVTNINVLFAANRVPPMSLPQDTMNLATTAKLQFSINGQDLGMIVLPLNQVWNEFYQVYTALADGVITIAIKDKNINGIGNDFAIDDVVFAPLSPDTKSDTIEVLPCRICNKPTVKINLPFADTSLCQGAQLTFKGSYANSTIPTQDALNYAWYKKGRTLTSASYKPVPANNLVPDSVASNLTFTSSGTYVLRVQDGKIPNDVSCYGEDSVKIVVDTVPSFTTKSATFCAGNSLMLDTLVLGLVPKHAVLKFYSDTTGSTPVAIPSTVTTAGTYYARPSSSLAQCTRSYKYGAIVVTGLAKPQVTDEPDETGGCVGSQTSVGVSATGTAPLSYQWYHGTATVGKDSAGIYFNNLTPADSGDYKVEVTNVCGTATSTIAKVKITLNDDPKVKLTVDKGTVCQDSVVVLKATPSGGGRDYTFTFRDGSGDISPVDQVSSSFTTSALAATSTFTVVMKFTTPCPAPNVTSPGSVTSDTTVQVDRRVTAIVGTPNPRKTCADVIKLPGSIQPPLSSSSGVWVLSPTSPNVATIQTPNDSASNLTDIASLSTVDLLWIVENGVCPKDTAHYTVNQVGSITRATISLNGGVYSNDDKTNDTADTLCVNSSYTLTGSTPVNGETGEWKIETAGTTNISVGNTPEMQSIKPTSVGETVLSWVITPSLAGCPSDSAVIVLKVHDKPSITTITTPSVLPCEDAALTDSSLVKYTSTLLPVFKWEIISAGTGSAKLSNSADSTAFFTNFKSTATSGWKDSVSVKTTVTNTCGSDDRITDIVFRLKPRELFLGDAIQGPDSLCENSSGAEYHFNNVQPNADAIRWLWDTTFQDYTTNDPNSPILILKDKAWGTLDEEAKAFVTAQLGNSCGYGITATKEVKITDAVDFKFTVSADKPNFCIPLDVVSVWANQTTPDSATHGNVAEYVFEDRYATILQGQSPSRVFRSGFSQDTVIWVRAWPNTSACLNDYGFVLDSVKLIGYNQPKDTLVHSVATICETKGVVELQLSPYNRNSGLVKWFNVVGTDTSELVAEQGKTKIERRGPSATGTVFATIGNKLREIDPNSQCPNGVSNAVAIKIYDQPNPVFSQDPLLIYFDENSPGIKMPFQDKGTIDSVFDIEYTPGIWLSTQDILVPTIKTTRDEIEVVYTLKLKSGDPSKGDIAVCEGEGTIRVVNTLPLRIPNAFSPNGDGKNENWVIEGLGKYPNTRVKVFNRWGNAIFTDNYGYSVPWDGTNNGALIASGTYYYVIDLLGSPDGKEEVRTGSLTIVK